MIVELTVIPIGVGTSLSRYVAEVVGIVRESGLPYESHSMGTNIECELEEAFEIVRRCRSRLYELGVERMSIVLRISDRRDKPYTIAGKLRSLDEKLSRR